MWSPIYRIGMTAKNLHLPRVTPIRQMKQLLTVAGVRLTYLTVRRVSKLPAEQRNDLLSLCFMVKERVGLFELILPPLDILMGGNSMFPDPVDFKRYTFGDLLPYYNQGKLELTNIRYIGNINPPSDPSSL